MTKTSWFVGKIMKKKAKRKSASGFDADPEQERNPPPAPTPVTFPLQPERDTCTWNDNAALPNFQTVFSRVLKPAHVKEDHVTALNINTQPVCSVDDLVPRAPDGQSYLPPLEPDRGSTAPTYANAARSAGDKRKEFDERLSELRVENGLAFRIIGKMVPPGEKPPRLAYMRKFWEGLDSMAQYWDCSLDCYYELEENDDEGEKRAKRQRLEAATDSVNGSPAHEEESQLPILQNGEHGGVDQEQNPTPDDEQHSIDSIEPKTETPEENNATADEGQRNVRSPNATPSLSPEPRSRMRYKGRRTGTGSEMPDQFRVDTVKAFVEGTIWPFQASVSIPRVVSLVHFNKLNLPVRQTAGVYRVPKDRIRGRQGILEGPILSLQTRAETDFQGDSDERRRAVSRLDFLREVGALLQLAQQRQREGKGEVKPGEGQWWTTTPRWGGGPGGEVEEQVGNSDTAQAAEGPLGAAKEKGARAASRESQRKTAAELWKELRCGKGDWDPKISYEAIGKDPTSAYDEVYLVSSINHHISIVKLTVHTTYIDYITSSFIPESLPKDPEWCRPKLERSQWFDLLDADQRVEAFRGLWGVMAYLTRDTGSTAQSSTQE